MEAGDNLPILRIDEEGDELSSPLGKRLIEARKYPGALAFITLIITMLSLLAGFLMAYSTLVHSLLSYLPFSVSRELILGSLLLSCLTSFSYLLLTLAGRLAGIKELEDPWANWMERWGGLVAAATGGIAVVVLLQIGVNIFGALLSGPFVYVRDYLAYYEVGVRGLVVSSSFFTLWFAGFASVVLGGRLVKVLAAGESTGQEASGQLGRKEQSSIVEGDVKFLAEQSAEQGAEQSAKQGAEQSAKQGAEQGAEQSAEQSAKQGAEQLPAVAEIAMDQVQAQELCPVCGCPCKEDDVVSCPRCHTSHHRECWEYVGACAIFGCDASRWKFRPSGGELVELKENVDSWVDLYRRHWSGLCVAVSGTVITLSSSILAVWTYRNPMILKALNDLAKTAGLVGIILTLYGLGTYAMYLLKERGVREKLGGLFQDQSSPAPSSDSREAVDKLDASRAETVIFSLLFGTLAYLLSLGVLLAAFRNVYHMYSWRYGALETILIWILAVVFPIALYGASRKRLAFTNSLQNRLAASVKKDDARVQ